MAFFVAFILDLCSRVTVSWFVQIVIGCLNSKVLHFYKMFKASVRVFVLKNGSFLLQMYREQAIELLVLDTI
jgi:hypothetical protein